MLLKEVYNARFFKALDNVCEKILPDFPKQVFTKIPRDRSFEMLELKQRSNYVTHKFNEHLPSDFEESSLHVLRLVDEIKKQSTFDNYLAFLFIPEWYEIYGIEHPDISMKVFEKITSLISCEFAVRPFVEKYPDKSMRYIQKWSVHRDEHVRRLASEGIRPRLPWAPVLYGFKKDPTAIIPILENLKEDPSEYVRRSVANNLNDISKDHPRAVIELTRRWIGGHEWTDKLLKHANRTLLKAGHEEALALFSYDTDGLIETDHFTLETPVLHMGEALSWRFQLSNRSNQTVKTRIEYAIYFLKTNGTLSKKVFKHTECLLQPKQKQSFVKNHKIFPITTRKYYSGKQQLALVINGRETERVDFELIC